MAISTLSRRRFVTCRASTPVRLRALLAALYALNVALAYLLMLVRTSGRIVILVSYMRQRNATQSALNAAPAHLLMLVMDLVILT